MHLVKYTIDQLVDAKLYRGSAYMGTVDKVTVNQDGFEMFRSTLGYWYCTTDIDHVHAFEQNIKHVELAPLPDCLL